MPFFRLVCLAPLAATAFVAALVATTVSVGACGGSTDPTTPSTGSSSSSGSSAPPTGCTAIACDDGLHVDFSFSQKGEYVFDITFDGTKATCKATIPLARDSNSACDRSDVILVRSGSMLPENQQSVGGLTLKTSAASVTIRAARDGVSLGEKTFAPEWKVSPGPNGAGCEPKECRQASTTFP